jgi:hypothetical protein
VAIEDELARTVRTLLADVFGTAPSGVAAKELDAAERRLGHRLPATLRAYYLAAGTHAASRALHHLVSPRKLALGEQGLVFMREQQDVCFYAIRTADLALADPPVFQGNRHEPTWYADCPRLASYLVKNLCWQAMEVLESNQHEVSEAAWQACVTRMPAVECGPPVAYPCEARRRGGLVACAFPIAGGRRAVCAASRNEASVDRFIGRLGKANRGTLRA